MRSDKEIINEASRCLNCKNPLCSMQGCPVQTKIPEFISKIKENKIEEAYNILQENNIMSEICCIVCPSEQQCKSTCIRGIKGEPIDINELEDFVNNWAKENNVNYNIKCEEKNNMKIAVIGSGPAGMACGIELLKKGYSVTMFEKENKIGGLLRYGIPDFRLKKELVDGVVEKLELAGAEIKTNMEFEKDFTINSLKEQGYKAIFLGIGAEKSNTYKLSKEECKSIYKANEFLKMYNEGKKVENLGTVVVIGGGNVAFDSARSSLRMGAEKVYILYRRDQKMMPARKIELEDAKQDGVEIIYTTKVIDGRVENGFLKEITCIKTKMEDGKPIDIENSEYKMKADTIIFAIGLTPDEELLSKLNLKTEKGLVTINETQMTTINGVFAGGDITSAKSTVCKAISQGKKAANSIDEYVKKI